MKSDSSVKILLKYGDRKLGFITRKPQFLSGGGKALLYGLIFGAISSFMVLYHGDTITSNQKFFGNLAGNLVADDTSVNLADYLSEKIRVLCIVMTSPGALHSRGYIIMDTWGKRCKKLIFFSSGTGESDSKFDNLVILKETDQLAKLREAFKYVYENHLNDFDWVLRSNDDAYVILENLRHLLYQYDPNWPVVIGHRFLPEGHMSGSYAISKISFTRLLENAFSNAELCETTSYDEDKAIAKCFQRINTMLVDGIDDDGKGRFFGINHPESALYPQKLDQYDVNYWTKLKQGIGNCCSDRLIAVQGYGNEHCYFLEYFIYKVHAFGRHRKREPLPKKFTLEEVAAKNS